MNGFNLSTYSYTDRKIAVGSYLLISLVVVLLFFYNINTYSKSASTQDQLTKKVVSIREEIKLLNTDLMQKKDAIARTGGTEEMENVAKEIKNINDVIARKNFSWSELFYSLEKATIKGISIEDIKPSYSTKKITISGVARRLKDITTFVDNLKETAYIKKGFLVSERESFVDKKYKVLSFEIVAEGSF